MKRLLFTLFLLLLPVSLFAERDATHPIRMQVPAESIRRVVIELPIGDIEVRNSAGAMISIEGESRYEYDKSRDQARAQAIADSATLVIERSGPRALIRPQFRKPVPNRRAQRRTTFAFVVSVPPDTAVEIRQDIGEIEIEGRFGHLDVDLDVGEVTVRVPRSSVKDLDVKSRIGEVNTDIGDTSVEREGLFAGTTRFTNLGGSANITIKVNVGEIDVRLK